MKAKLEIDLGQSEIRGILKIGAVDSIDRKETIFLFPNLFSAVRKNHDLYANSQDYNIKNSSLLSLDPTREYTGRGKYLATATSGLLQLNEFSKTSLPKPSEQDKVDSPQSYLAVMTLIVRSLDWMMNNNIVEADSIEQASKQVNFDVSILLPPTQKERTEEEFAKRLLGTHTITSYLPKAVLDITIENVTLEQEGVVTYIALMYTKENFEPRPQISELLTGKTVLIIDMGASTVDTVVIRNGITLEESRQTFSTGGNNVLNLIKTALRKITPRKITNEELYSISETGEFNADGTVLDVADIITTAKQEVADSINSDVVDFLGSTSFSINDVDLIIPLGGNTASSENLAIDTLGLYVIDSLLESTPSAEVVNLDDYSFDDLVIPLEEQYLIGKKTIFDRLLNVYSLSLVSDLIALQHTEEEEFNL